MNARYILFMSLYKINLKIIFQLNPI